MQELVIDTSTSMDSPRTLEGAALAAERRLRAMRGYPSWLFSGDLDAMAQDDEAVPSILETHLGLRTQHGWYGHTYKAAVYDTFGRVRTDRGGPKRPLPSPAHSKAIRTKAELHKVRSNAKFSTKPNLLGLRNALLAAEVDDWKVNAQHGPLKLDPVKPVPKRSVYSLETALPGQ